MYFETVKVMGKFPASVLATVNAPYSKKLDAPTPRTSSHDCAGQTPLRVRLKLLLGDRCKQPWVAVAYGTLSTDIGQTFGRLCLAVVYG